MTCTQCKAISVHQCDPAKRSMFNPACLWCGARAIQYTQRVLLIGRDAKVQRCREVLARWLEFGHSEAEIRRLVALDEAPLEPVSSGQPRERGG